MTCRHAVNLPKSASAAKHKFFLLFLLNYIKSFLSCQVFNDLILVKYYHEYRRKAKRAEKRKEFKPNGAFQSDGDKPIIYCALGTEQVGADRLGHYSACQIFRRKRRLSFGHNKRLKTSKAPRNFLKVPRGLWLYYICCFIRNKLL